MSDVVNSFSPDPSAKNMTGMHLKFIGRSQGPVLRPGATQRPHILKICVANQKVLVVQKTLRQLDSGGSCYLFQVTVIITHRPRSASPVCCGSQNRPNEPDGGTSSPSKLLHRLLWTIILERSSKLYKPFL